MHTVRNVPPESHQSDADAGPTLLCTLQGAAAVNGEGSEETFGVTVEACLGGSDDMVIVEEDIPETIGGDGGSGQTAPSRNSLMAAAVASGGSPAIAAGSVVKPGPNTPKPRRASGGTLLPTGSGSWGSQTA